MANRSALVSALLAIGLILSTSPARADVKAGVAKWRAGDYAGAVAEWKKPAAAGNPLAQFNMAQAYKLGRGVPADPAMAVDLYRKAAAQGFEPAEANLGWVLFQQGKRQEAIPLLQRAAAREDAHSQYLLGIAYFNGDSVERDWGRAYSLMSRASAKGLPQAQDALRKMDSRIPLADRQKAMAPLGKVGATPPAPPVALAKAPPVASDSAGKAGPVVPPAATAASNTAAPSPAPATPATPAKEQWRVQLGAFSSQQSAAKAWATMKNKVPRLADLEPSYVSSGTVTRLRAGPIASRSEANRLCAEASAASVACFPVAQ